MDISVAQTPRLKKGIARLAELNTKGETLQQAIHEQELAVIDAADLVAKSGSEAVEEAAQAVLGGGGQSDIRQLRQRRAEREEAHEEAEELLHALHGARQKLHAERRQAQHEYDVEVRRIKREVADGCLDVAKTNLRSAVNDYITLRLLQGAQVGGPVYEIEMLAQEHALGVEIAGRVKGISATLSAPARTGKKQDVSV